jgi:hypothetical protein
MINFLKLYFILMICFSFDGYTQPGFFKQYWAEYDGNVNNNSLQGERTRVNDREASTDPAWYRRSETQANGLVLIDITDTIQHVDRAELVCEMWGGHPHTAKKRFQINGKNTYFLPSEMTEKGNCEYLFPTVSVDKSDLVRGTNTIQLNCDRGKSFWGHFLLDEIAINTYLIKESPLLMQSGLADLTASPKIQSKVLEDFVEIWLNIPEKFTNQIKSVFYFGHYLGFDESGLGIDEQWHGYQFKRIYRDHIGTGTQAPFLVKWDTRMIPDQGKPMSVKALIEFDNGIFYWTDKIGGLTFPVSRPRVQLIHCSLLPEPFWSRDNQLRTALIELPGDLSEIESAELHVRNWDGGEGSILNPFKLNGIPYKITDGNAPHDFIYTVNKVNPRNLNPGINEIQLLSDTKHHGIELCLPGPCLIVKYKK